MTARTILRSVRSPMTAAAIPSPAARPLLRLIALLVLAYNGLLVVLDRWVFPWPPLPLPYHTLNLGTALLVAAILAAPALRTRAGLPLALALFISGPLVSTFALVPATLYTSHPFSPILGATGLLVRVFPIFIFGVIILAWFYAWSRVVLYCLAFTALHLSLLGFSTLSPRSSPTLVSNQLVMSLCFTGGLLLVGYLVSAVVTRLRAQQAMLDAANQRLRAQASTLESLTISRERNRLARELHDTLAHTLSSLSVQLTAIHLYWSRDPAQAEALLAEAEALVRSGLRETRNALVALRASPLDDLGLELALCQLAETAAARADLTLDWQVPDPFPPLPPEWEQGIYRVAQEALTNVVRHAQARQLTVAFSGPTPTVTLRIQDDGRGFDPAAGPGHYGLVGMRERAALLGGELTIQSRPGGTTLLLRLGAGGDT